MDVIVVGPNLPSRLAEFGSFLVHQSGCRVLDTYRRERLDLWPIMDAQSRAQIVNEIYHDQIVENDEDVRAYENEVHFAKCTEDLEDGFHPNVLHMLTMEQWVGSDEDIATAIELLAAVLKNRNK